MMLRFELGQWRLRACLGSCSWAPPCWRAEAVPWLHGHIYQDPNLMCWARAALAMSAAHASTKSNMLEISLLEA